MSKVDKYVVTIYTSNGPVVEQYFEGMIYEGKKIDFIKAINNSAIALYQHVGNISFTERDIKVATISIPVGIAKIETIYEVEE